MRTNGVDMMAIRIGRTRVQDVHILRQSSSSIPKCVPSFGHRSWPDVELVPALPQQIERGSAPGPDDRAQHPPRLEAPIERELVVVDLLADLGGRAEAADVFDAYAFRKIDGCRCRSGRSGARRDAGANGDDRL